MHAGDSVGCGSATVDHAHVLLSTSFWTWINSEGW